MAKRPRGSARGDTRARARATAFEALVDRALAAIPAPYSDALREVAVVIEHEPSAEQLEENGLEADESMYGLYEGVPRTDYGADWAASPNRITLFRVPLEEDFPDREELEDEVRLTVLHELAHHLGIDDDRLDELGAG
ncbi:MAG TPA: metallopeptidase family protein [Candidatus Limnocylindrales bacterium]|jgi:predicted Zn-dependent protease with MMP-like domain|nr:metallopeptidase family protein [Candidatus Limnocylindrales bacterium]